MLLISELVDNCKYIFNSRMSVSQTASESCYKDGLYYLVFKFGYALISMYRFKGNGIMSIYSHYMLY